MRKPPSQQKQSAQVRIIGGQWKRTPLVVLDAEGLRPTPDRVRETAFNWLNHLLDGGWGGIRCLDLFAGSGALGFEAASRGAADVLMVETYLPAIKQLEATKTKLNAAQVNILRGDALAVARNLVKKADENQSKFNVIFLDPPYHQEWLAKVLPLCERLLTEDGIIYAEAEQRLDLPPEASIPSWLAEWEIIRVDKAGMVFYHLLRRKTRPEIQA